MKKRIISVLLVLLMLSAVIGCGSSQKEDKTEEPPAEDETLFVINGLEFHLDTDASFYGLDYVISQDLREITHDEYYTPYVQYDYLQDDGNNLLFFRIFFYKGQGTDAAIADLGLDAGITLTEGSTGNFEYSYYPEPRDDGGTIHFYFVNRDGNTYVLNFISRYDIADFEGKVLSRIVFH